MVKYTKNAHISIRFTIFFSSDNSKNALPFVVIHHNEKGLTFDKVWNFVKGFNSKMVRLKDFLSVLD